jgi:hypothetical protein
VPIVLGSNQIAEDAVVGASGSEALRLCWQLSAVNSNRLVSNYIGQPSSHKKSGCVTLFSDKINVPWQFSIVKMSFLAYFKVNPE